MYPQGQRYEWVATPPPGAAAPAPRRYRPGYIGPPAYRLPPRWGFPPISWRWQTSVTEAQEVPAARRVRPAARASVIALYAAAAISVLAALAEGWRYVVLLRSRGGALPSSLVSTSDALVVTAGLLSIAAAATAAVIVLWWLALARRAASDLTGYHPARPDWHVLPALFVPGLNLVLPGAILTELEHAASGRPAQERPSPGRLVLAWWITWAVAGLVFGATVLWRLRDGVQAQADGIILTALADLVAAAVAVLTALVVRRLSALLEPVRQVKLERVVRVDGAPEPPLRPARRAGATR